LAKLFFEKKVVNLNIKWMLERDGIRHCDKLDNVRDDICIKIVHVVYESLPRLSMNFGCILLISVSKL
jgi:hypothetical protein